MKHKITLLWGLLVMMLAFSFMQCSDDDSDIIYGQCELSGLVLDTAGKGIEGAKVTVMIVNEGHTPTSTLTDANGRYHISLTKSTDELVLEVQADGYVSYYCVITPPYKSPVHGQTLGTASIVMDDIILVAK